MQKTNIYILEKPYTVLASFLDSSKISMTQSSHIGAKMSYTTKTPLIRKIYKLYGWFINRPKEYFLLDPSFISYSPCIVTVGMVKPPRADYQTLV